MNDDIDHYKKLYRYWHTVACIAFSIIGGLIGALTATIIMLTEI